MTDQVRECCWKGVGIKKLVPAAFITIVLLAWTAAGQKLEPTLEPTPSTESPKQLVLDPTPSPEGQKLLTKDASPLGVRDWTTDTWTAIAAVVAFAALIQPWIIGVWQRFFRRGYVDIHETATIEIGFSAFGATIGLMGTLRSLRHDMFVQSASLTLSKVEDSTSRRFEWGLFRKPKTVVGPAAVQSAEVALEAPFSFMIATIQPYQYNIIFLDVVVLQQVQSLLENFRQAWLKYLIQETDLDIQAPASDPNAQQRVMQKLRRAHQKFSSTQQYRETFDSLNQLYYWEPETYKLVLDVRTARPDRTFTKTWSFTLLDNDVSNLRNNVTSVLEDIAGVPITAGTYLFASAPYS